MAVHTYEPVVNDCDHWDTYNRRHTCRPCRGRWEAAGHAAGLGVGHVWNNVQCGAYHSMRPSDCTCSEVTV